MRDYIDILITVHVKRLHMNYDNSCFNHTRDHSRRCSELAVRLMNRLQQTGFSLGRLHMGRFVPHMGEVQGDKALMRGGNIDLMGGPNFDGLYHKLKVLLLLSCNYMMQFISYDSIKTG